MDLAVAILWLKKYQGYMPISEEDGIRRHAFDLTDETVDALLLALEERTALTRLARLNGICDVCDSESCAYNNEGICKVPLVHGKAPTYTDHDGCIDSIVSERNGGTYHDV